MNKNCQDFDRLFLDFVNGHLDETSRQFCKKHWKNCESCSSRQEYRDLMKLWKKLEIIPEIEPSPDFLSKMQQQMIREEEQQELFWKKVDNLFNTLRFPALATVLTAIVFMVNVSNFNQISVNNRQVAMLLKTGDTSIILTKREQFRNNRTVEIKIKKYTNLTLAEAFNLIKNKEG